jgi:Xaa-Pro dipeptidase
VAGYQSKILRSAARRRGLGSFGDLGPGALALAEWQALGLELPDLPAMRAYRLARVRQELAARDYAGIVVTDPINMRYATDSANMQVWCLHNPARYAFVATDGPVIVFKSGDRMAEHAAGWAAELADLVRAHGGGNRRLALDHVNPEGVEALRAQGISVHEGQAVMELARAIKSPDEIKAMRCALAACEAAMAVMQQRLRPGVTEQELWAHLHAETMRRGGEWIETRLLSSGPRTNPWFQECSSRVIEAGDLVAFDTDLIGPYGYCADISRTWLCGDGHPSNVQVDLYRRAREQIAFNLELVRPGVGLREFSAKAFSLPERFLANRYSAIAHGVGVCDEYPAVYYPEDVAVTGYDGVLEAGMTICIESYIGEAGGAEGVKLEEQALITPTGAEVLSRYPLEDAVFG